MRLTTSAIVGARESAIQRELQLDEGVEELASSLEAAQAEVRRQRQRRLLHHPPPLPSLQPQPP